MVNLDAVKHISMDEIILALQNWQALRNNREALIDFFSSKKGFELNVALFPQGKAIHAYPAIKDNRLYFIAISEEMDVQSPISFLNENCYWLECKEGLNNDQEIPVGIALQRIADWENTFPVWIEKTIDQEGAIYQTFHIPTDGLQKESYSVFFALKASEANNNLSVADLVLKSGNGLFFDTVKSQPPYKDRQKYYLLNLI